MATARSVWPLPSQSPRVRLLLYLAEGMIIGAATALIVLDFAGAFLLDVQTGSFEPTISVPGVGIILLFMLLVLRGIAINVVDHRFSRDNLPEYQDWKETRRWIWVAAVALLIGGLLLGVSVLLWGWWAVVFLYDADLLMGGTILVGLVLYLYILHRLGVKII